MQGKSKVLRRPKRFVETNCFLFRAASFPSWARSRRIQLHFHPYLFKR